MSRRTGLILLLFAGYLVAALASLEIDVERVAEGVARGGKFLGGFLQPDFASRWSDVSSGMLESLTMTVVATLAGLLLSLPVALGAARNMAPTPIYLACRAIVATSRSLHELVIAILFVVAVGFGPLAGVLTLAFASVGFLGKLLAEEIEEIDPAQLEAIRATGARGPQRLWYAVVPQVTPRLVGLTLYRLDINFRESAIIGVVGAGGIGATLNTAFQRYEYDVAAAILILIIAVVLLAEYASGHVRRRVM
ncbi:phosphonate ABC transporter permease [Acidobacteria bacterium Mor1]|nr:phosphonate ABC transporter permease [Acidobacteria bacterium Mor1]